MTEKQMQNRIESVRRATFKLQGKVDDVKCYGRGVIGRSNALLLEIAIESLKNAERALIGFEKKTEE